MGNNTPSDRSVSAAKIAEAKAKGYEGTPCDECGQYTVAKKAGELTCDTCGYTTSTANLPGDETNDIGC